jgi:hypothetical protein
MALVYLSLPLTGRFARRGRDLLRGAELALEQAQPADVETVVLDSAGGLRPARDRRRGARLGRRAMSFAPHDGLDVRYSFAGNA